MTKIMKDNLLDAVCGLFITVVMFACGAVYMRAQTTTTPPTPPATRLSWEHDRPLAEVRTYTFALKVDEQAPVPVVAFCEAPIPQGTAKAYCSAPIPASAIGGEHTFIMTATDAFGSADSDPIVGRKPGKPLNINIVTTTTTTTTVTVTDRP